MRQVYIRWFCHRSHPTPRTEHMQLSIQDNSGESTLDNEHLHCNDCDGDFPITHFSRWAIIRGHKLCRACSYQRSKKALALRRSSPERRLLALLRTKMHQQGVSKSTTSQLQLAAMCVLINKFGARSVISGVQAHLTVVQWDPKRTLGFENVVLMTESEGREHNKRGIGDYHEAFVSHIESLLASSGQRGDTEEDYEMYPPLSKQTRGFSREAAMWHAKRFGVVHPAGTSSVRVA